MTLELLEKSKMATKMAAVTGVNIVLAITPIALMLLSQY